MSGEDEELDFGEDTFPTQYRQPSPPSQSRYSEPSKPLEQRISNNPNYLEGNSSAGLNESNGTTSSALIDSRDSASYPLVAPTPIRVLTLSNPVTNGGVGKVDEKDANLYTKEGKRLPPNWLSKVSTTTGDYYYKDTLTGKSHWIIPQVEWDKMPPPPRVSDTPPLPLATRNDLESSLGRITDPMGEFHSILNHHGQWSSALVDCILRIRAKVWSTFPVASPFRPISSV